MIDLLTTFLVTVMALYACVRAIKLDRQLPWFETRSMYEKAKASQAPVEDKRAWTGTQPASAGKAVEPWRGKAAENDPYGAAVRSSDPRRK